jgi:pimeloyl-ACP methyl ester carboxylesterase
LTDIMQSEHRVASGRAGLSIMLRNKCTAVGTTPVLFVHGATYPSTVMFDYAIGGVSWLDWMARAGFDVWCVDLLGYGAADRPPEMSIDASLNAPLVDTEEAVGDVKRAIDYILARRNCAQIDLLGYSWGSAICGQVAGDVPQTVRRLVLGGALWLLEDAPQIRTGATLGAYRTVDAEAIESRWLIGLEEAQKAVVAPSGDIARWARAAIASDPQSLQHQPPRLRAPAGVVKDVQTYWMQGQPTYDPGLIRCPVQIVVGEWDRETSPAQGLQVFDRLRGTSTRRYTVIGAATHSMLLETQRHQLYDVAATFLAE